MAGVDKAFVARLSGLVVLGPDGESVGRVCDAVVTRRSQGQPRVLGLVVELFTRRRIFLPILRIGSIDATSVSLISGTVNLHRFTSHPGETLVLGDMVGTTVDVLPDAADRSTDAQPNVVIDVEIKRRRSRDWVVSRLAVRPRRSRAHFGRRAPLSIVEWSRIREPDIAPISQGEQDAAELIEKFQKMRPADVANAMRELPTTRRSIVARTLDDERLADILQELPLDEQTQILSQLELERAADVLEAMDPDDVADLLGELPESEAESLLQKMNPKDSAPVRRLLIFEPHTAGGLMTPEPIVLAPQTTVAEALALVRAPDLSPAIASVVFVCRPPVATPSGRYLGVVHIQALLREPPANMVGEVLDTTLPTLLPTDSADAVTRYFATYNLVCGPVVDEEGRLLGAVSVDDLLDHLLPDGWRDLDLHEDHDEQQSTRGNVDGSSNLGEVTP